MNKKLALYQHYKNCDLWLPTDPAKRQFKFLDFQGNVRIHHIANLKELRKTLIKYLPHTAWYSSYTAINAQQIRQGTKYHYLSNLILFDWDSHNNEPIEPIKQEVYEFYQFLEEQGITPIYCSFSGRGFHIVIEQKFEKHPCEPKKEIQNRKVYIDKLIKSFETTTGRTAKFHKETAYNWNQQIRIPKTINMNSGCECIILKKNEILKLVTRQKIPVDEKNTPDIKRAEEAEDQTAPLKFIKNTVGNRQILIAQYNKKNYLSTQKKAKYLIKHYNLTDILLFEQKNDIYCVSLKTLEKNRIRKILRQTKAKNYVSHKKYGFAILPINTKLLGIIKSENTQSHTSKPHKTLINKIYRINLQYKNEQGKKITITQATKKT